jgi:hypothetical protein
VDVAGAGRDLRGQSPPRGEKPMPRWWRTSSEQIVNREEQAAYYRRTGAMVMKASLEPRLAQAEADAALVRDIASFDPIREYGFDTPRGPIRSCVICRATARAEAVDHDPDCLWVRAVKAMTERVETPSGLPDTELLTGPGD